MKSDLTRDTFSDKKHYTRVLKQQGRVDLDADSNEQTAILLHLLRSLAADLIGEHGGPAYALGFKVERSANSDFSLTPGQYYVDGLLCENDEKLTYSKLPGAVVMGLPPVGEVHNYLVYLDVWEQHVTYLQDPTIREPALNGPDTASRARLVTQVRVSRNLPGNDGPAPIPNPPPDRKKFDAPGDINNLWIQFVETLQPHNRGMLAAKAQPDKHNDPELCLASPNAGYGGMENQLYRVEIQRAGTAWDQSTKNRPQAATFKWSRENGAVVFSVYALTNNIATIEKPLDDRLGLHVGEWVEILGDLEELYSCPDAGDTPYHCHGVLAEVVAIQPDSDPTRLEVRLSSPDGVKIHALGLDSPLPNHPLLRRWDHRPLPADWPPDDQKQLLQDSEGALLVKEGVWLDLENGVKVLFKPAPDNSPFHQYRSGDYWLIPARTAVEDVLWPQDKDGGPKHLPPHGIEHHYAPLAFFPVMQGALLKDPVSLQRSFDHRAKLVS